MPPTPPELVALVVGAATAEGRRAVAELGRPGVCLGLAGADADELAPLVVAAHDAGARATLLPGDLAQPGMVARVVDAVRNAHGRVDLLVLVTGASGLTGRDGIDVLGADSDRWRAVVAADALVPFLVLQEVGRSMAAAGRGRVVLVERPGAPVSVAGLVRSIAAAGLDAVVVADWTAGLGGGAGPVPGVPQ